MRRLIKHEFQFPIACHKKSEQNPLNITKPIWSRAGAAIDHVSMKPTRRPTHLQETTISHSRNFCLLPFTFFALRYLRIYPNGPVWSHDQRTISHYMCFCNKSQTGWRRACGYNTRTYQWLTWTFPSRCSEMFSLTTGCFESVCSTTNGITSRLSLKITAVCHLHIEHH